MRYSGGRFFATIVTTALITAAAVAAPGQPEAAAATPPAVAGHGPALSTAVRHDLLRLYASYRHLPVADIARAVPGSGRVARRPASGAEWAALGFQPAAGVPQAVATSFQDGAGTGLFTRAAGSGTWKMTGLGGEPLGCGTRVPAVIRSRWRLSACPSVVSSPPSQQARAAIPASGAAGVAAIAESEVGVSDIPAESNFGGLDCNPFTAIEAPWVSTAGCGTGSKFPIKYASELWCADFTKWVWAEAGVTSDLSVLTPAAASFWTWGKDHGEQMAEDPADPQVGDAVVFYPDTTPNGSYADHVGIVTAVNANGTVNLVNGDFRGTTNISVQQNSNVSLRSWAAQIWGPDEDWTFVSPELLTTQPNPQPAAAADQFGNKYAFWENSSGDLTEVIYTAATGAWGKPVTVTAGGHPVGPLGSAPTVAVSTQTAGNYSDQYVFWEGPAPADDLYEAHWNGSWHGPVDLGDGPLGSAPTAGVDGSGRLSVYWATTGHELTGIQSTASGWSRPAVVTVAGTPVGSLGSAPSVAVGTDGSQYVFWESAAPASSLTEVYRTGGSWHGPADLGDGPLGSPPTAGADGSGSQYVFWRNGSSLAEAYYSVWTGRWTGPVTVLPGDQGAGPLESAPVVAVNPLGGLAVFWEGTNTDPGPSGSTSASTVLWEADEAGGIWAPQADDGFGPLS